MSRKTRALARAAATNNRPQVTASLGSPLPGGIWNQSVFDAANFSTRRGYIYVPTLETRREVDTYSRLEMIRRARWLKRNTGFTKRCINGLANMTGALMPHPLTSDKDWNKAALKQYRDRACNAATFDLSARFNVNNYQPLITRSRLADGDFLSVFTEANGGAAVMSYESHQVSQGFRRPGDNGFYDGVKVGRGTEHLAYSVVDNFLEGTTVEIPAASCVLNADYDSFGWRRGVTSLHHAINNLLDVTEIASDTKLGIKGANRIAYYEYIAPGSAPGNAPRTAADAVRAQQYGESREQSAKGTNFNFEDSFRGGKVPTLDPGREIKQLLDERPHPNTLGFLEYLNRDIAAGFEMSSDVLWNIAKLGGASVRYVLADAQSTIERHQQLLVDQFLTRFWVYFCAMEMKAGRLPKCKDPSWWLVGWLPPAKLTVDISRDGKLSIDLHRAGMLTMKRWYGMQGLDDYEQDAQTVEEYARRLVLCQEVEARYRAEGYNIKIDPERVFPTAIPGAGIQPAQPGADPNGNAGDPSFSAPEAFAQISESLDEIKARFGVAA